MKRSIRLGYAADRTYSGPPSYSNPIAYNGEGHLITVAPTRSGKGRDVLVPALLTYQHSVLCIDPKGQLSTISRAHRARMGQEVKVLNPFNILPDELGPSSRFNPMAALDPEADSFGADAMSLADAIVGRDQRGDSHWSDSARQLAAGIIMGLAAFGKDSQKNLVFMQDLISGPPSVLREFVADIEDKDGEGFIKRKLMRYEKVSEESRELLSIISTANTQSEFTATSKAIAHNLTGSDFRFRDLKHRPTTVYLVLPAKYIDTCGKWFRLVVAAALADLWNEDGEVPVLAILDEFAQLGHLQAIENAMGMAAGFGLQLWPILQDLTQLKGLYGDRWETFLANAGVQQFFAPRDNFSANYLSEACGDKTVSVRSHSENVSSGTSINSGRGLFGGNGTKGTNDGTGTGISYNPRERRALLPQEIRGLRGDQFLMFTETMPGKFTLGHRAPYYEIPEFRGLYSPDPYHKPKAAPEPPPLEHPVSEDPLIKRDREQGRRLTFLQSVGMAFKGRV